MGNDPEEGSRRASILGAAALAASVAACDRGGKREEKQPTPTPRPTAATTPAPMPAAASAASWLQLDPRPFKLGLIGCGEHAVKNLIPAALKLPGNRITAVCDIVPARAEAARKLAGGEAKMFDDYRALLKQADLDAVIIATPPHLHRAMVEEAFANGHHVFCETIMALTVADCRAMVKAQAASGKALQIGHFLRYHAMYSYVQIPFGGWRRWIGKISNIRGQWKINGTGRKPRESLDGVDYRKWGYDEPDHLLNWQLYTKYSGGCVTEQALHQLDFVNWLLDDTLPQAVHGVGRTEREDGRTVFDHVHLIYEYPDNVVATFEYTTTDSFSPFGEAPIIIQSDKGTLVMNHLGRYAGLFFIEPGVAEELWMPAAHRADFESPNVAWKSSKAPIIVVGGPSDGARLTRLADVVALLDVQDLQTAQLLVGPYAVEMAGLKRSVLDGKKPYCDGTVGLKSAATALLALEAMEKGQRVVVPKDVLS